VNRGSNNFVLSKNYFRREVMSCIFQTKQVQQQVIEVITYIASTVKKFLKRCVVLCLLGMSSFYFSIYTILDFINIPCIDHTVYLLHIQLLIMPWYNADCSNYYYIQTISGISEKVADIKTRAPAMKCLTAFCEAVGPGFVFDRVWYNIAINPSLQSFCAYLQFLHKPQFGGKVITHES
jgi:hypothetical protein